jgi:hypothetical protein
MTDPDQILRRIGVTPEAFDTAEAADANGTAGPDQKRLLAAVRRIQDLRDREANITALKELSRDDPFRIGFLKHYGVADAHEDFAVAAAVDRGHTPRAGDNGHNHGSRRGERACFSRGRC